METLIKKYNNRKLYDTTTSSYITLTEICNYIRNDVKVKVISNTTGEDITNSILLDALVAGGVNVNTEMIYSLINKGGQNG